jgi:hypothetical protein
MLCIYMTSLVVMSGTMSAQKRRSNSQNSSVGGFIFFIDVICIVLRILVSNTISCCPSFCSFISMFVLMLVGSCQFIFGIRPFSVV